MSESCSRLVNVDRSIVPTLALVLQLVAPAAATVSTAAAKQHVASKSTLDIALVGA
jgi:hypothetical protein